jgi:hypothetical protein
MIDVFMSSSLELVAQTLHRQPKRRKGGKMRNAKMGSRILLYGLIVMSGMSTQEAPAQSVVFLIRTYTNGAVARIRINPNARKADFQNGGTFALEVSESFYILTTEFDFGASGGGVVDLETKINRRTQELTNTIAGKNRGNFAQYPLSGTCADDQPWSGAAF